MSVTTTAHRGLLKPDRAEIPRDWASEVVGSPDLDEIAEQNALILDNYLRSQSLQSFVPAWKDSGGTTFNLGTDSTAIGLYKIYPGGFVAVWYHFVVGTGHNIAGTNVFRFPTPTIFDGSFHSSHTTFGDVLGEGILVDSSVTANRQTCAVGIASIGSAELDLMTEAGVGKLSRFVRPDKPFTWAVDDKLSFSALYKATGV